MRPDLQNKGKQEEDPLSSSSEEQPTVARMKPPLSSSSEEQPHSNENLGSDGEHSDSFNYDKGMAEFGVPKGRGFSTGSDDGHQITYEDDITPAPDERDITQAPDDCSGLPASFIQAYRQNVLNYLIAVASYEDLAPVIDNFSKIKRLFDYEEFHLLSPSVSNESITLLNSYAETLSNLSPTISHSDIQFDIDRSYLLISESLYQLGLMEGFSPVLNGLLRDMSSKISDTDDLRSGLVTTCYEASYNSVLLFKNPRSHMLLRIREAKQAEQAVEYNEFETNAADNPDSRTADVMRRLGFGE